MVYQHYSFDLWLTLIKSNPMFKQQRARIFQSQYNSLGKPLEEVERIFRRVDVMVNSVNEATGKNIDAEEMYLMVISEINDGNVCLQDIDIAGLYNNMEVLLMEHLPQVYCDRTAGVLASIKQNANCSISLLSNTGFIKGSTLRKVLKQLELDIYLDFQLYSDEHDLSKPNQKFFQLMLDEVAAIKNISLNQIIHVGDNPRADVWGADSVGINSLLINSNNTSILKLIPDVAQHVFTA